MHFGMLGPLQLFSPPACPADGNPPPDNGAELGADIGIEAGPRERPVEAGTNRIDCAGAAVIDLNEGLSSARVRALTPLGQAQSAATAKGTQVPVRHMLWGLCNVRARA